jgi:putative DNA primase/helicase
VTVIDSVEQFAARQRRERDENVREAEQPLSEDAAALMFAERYSGALLFDHDAGRWLEWDGAHFKPDGTDRALHYARELTRELAAGRSARVKVNGGKTAFCAGVERFSRADPVFARTSDDWDHDPFLLGTPGGTVDLRTGALRVADPADCITRVTAAAPADTADCPEWKRFLHQTTAGDEELIEFLKLWSGYCLTGLTSEHALVFIYGGGGNGKGVFLNAISEVMGAYAVTAAMDAFEASKAGRHPTDLAMLRGARLVTASETEEGRAWAEARIKAITGGDPITARYMRQDFFTYRPAFKLTIAGNHTPVLHNVDDAARRRFNIVPFLTKPDQPDLLLPAKLRAEYPAILRWMIEGCLEWQQRRLPRPRVIKDATAEYFAEQDMFQQWIDDCCEVKFNNTAKFEAVNRLYSSWRTFAEHAGERGGSTKSFAQQMRRRGFKAGRTGSTRLFYHVSLKPEIGARSAQNDG